MHLPYDIEREIRLKTSSDDDADTLRGLCFLIMQKSWNVGNEQLVRCLLVLSDFEPEKFNNISESISDPRDIIFEAHSNYPSINWGINKFT